MAALLHLVCPLHTASVVLQKLAVLLPPICLSTSVAVYVQGVVKALFDNGLLPKVLSGSSVGSISASLFSASEQSWVFMLHSCAPIDKLMCLWIQPDSCLLLVQFPQLLPRAMMRSWQLSSRTCMT